MRDDDPRPPHRRRDRNQIPAARKSPGLRVPVLTGVALLVLVGAGLGGYYFFGRGSVRSAEYKVRPPRTLPPDMFAYVPASDTDIRFVDVQYGREVADAEGQLAIDGVFPNAMRQ